MREIESKFRRFLSAWQFWMGIAFLAQITVVIGLVVVSNQTNATNLRVAREQTIHQAQVRGAADSAYNSCVQSIPELRRISRHLRGVNQLAGAVVANAKAVLDSTDPGDPFYPLRKSNYDRVMTAAEKISAVRALPIPTKKECGARKKTILVQGGLA